MTVKQETTWIIEALKTEWSDQFIEYMKNRMLVSYAKYGPVQQAFPAKINALQSSRERVQKYLETGNQEWLVDAANFLLIEFLCPSLPNAHFRAADSDESIGRVHKATGKATFEPNEDSAVAAFKRRMREGD